MRESARSARAAEGRWGSEAEEEGELPEGEVGEANFPDSQLWKFFCITDKLGRDAQNERRVLPPLKNGYTFLIKEREAM